MAPRAPWILTVGCLVALSTVSCSSSAPSGVETQPVRSSASPAHPISPTPGSRMHRRQGDLPGMPALLSRNDVYAADRAGALAPVVRHDRPLIYVPNSLSDTVSVIDPTTYKVIGTHRVGALPQHVTPSYDLRTLYVLNDKGNTVTTIDPRTGRFGRTIPVDDPYNMYFTPDGKYAIVVAERLSRLDFVDPHTMHLVHSLPVACRGIDHADFSANGRYAAVQLRVLGPAGEGQYRQAEGDGLPQPAGWIDAARREALARWTVFYVADMAHNGVWLINGASLNSVGFRATGMGAHGLYVAGTRASSTSPTATKAHLASSISDPQGRTKWRSPAAAAPTWAASPRTARCCGCPGATTAWSMRSPQRAESCSPRFPSAAVHTGSASIRSRADTPSATPGSSADQRAALLSDLDRLVEGPAVLERLSGRRNRTGCGDVVLVAGRVAGAEHRLAPARRIAPLVLTSASIALLERGAKHLRGSSAASRRRTSVPLGLDASWCPSTLRSTPQSWLCQPSKKPVAVGRPSSTRSRPAPPASRACCP